VDPSGEWHDVPMIPGFNVINLGDIMPRWTNDRWRSALHRVVKPPEKTRGFRRSSIVFSHHPNYDTIIDCLPTCAVADTAPNYEAICVSDYYVVKRSQQRMAREQANAA
jgi:isopenicillin N synthase-like dioxygenase